MIYVVSRFRVLVKICQFNLDLVQILDSKNNRGCTRHGAGRAVRGLRGRERAAGHPGASGQRLVGAVFHIYLSVFSSSMATAVYMCL